MSSRLFQTCLTFGLHFSVLLRLRVILGLFCVGPHPRWQPRARLIAERSVAPVRAGGLGIPQPPRCATPSSVLSIGVSAGRTSLLEQNPRIKPRNRGSDGPGPGVPAAA